MKVNSFFELLGSIVVLAMITDVVSSKNTASIVTNSGNAFANVLKSAQGK